jgi:hypothetical protein
MYDRLISFLIGSALSEQRVDALDRFRRAIQEKTERDCMLWVGSPDEPSYYATVCGNALMGCEARFRAPTNSVAFWLFLVPLVPTCILMAYAGAERLPARTLSESAPTSSMEVMKALVVGLLVAISALGALATILIEFWRGATFR